LPDIVPLFAKTNANSTLLVSVHDPAPPCSFSPAWNYTILLLGSLQRLAGDIHQMYRCDPKREWQEVIDTRPSDVLV
jgi:hypothetical protein